MKGEVVSPGKAVDGSRPPLVSNEGIDPAVGEDFHAIGNGQGTCEDAPVGQGPAVPQGVAVPVAVVWSVTV